MDIDLDLDFPEDDLHPLEDTQPLPLSPSDEEQLDIDDEDDDPAKHRDGRASSRIKEGGGYPTSKNDKSAGSRRRGDGKIEKGNEDDEVADSQRQEAAIEDEEEEEEEHVAGQDVAFVPGMEPSQELQDLLGRCRTHAHFYEVLSPLQVVEEACRGQQTGGAMSRGVRLHTVAALAGSTLLVAQGSTSWRTVRLQWQEDGAKGVATPALTKVVVHHEYGGCGGGSAPVRRVVAVLREDGCLAVLDYPALQAVCQLSSVRRVYSADVGRSGRPQLLIVKRSGERIAWSPLMVDSAYSSATPAAAAASDGTQQQLRPSPAQQQVTRALQARLQGSVSRLNRLQRSCDQRAAFIARHLATLRARLSGDATHHQAQPGAAVPLSRPNVRHTPSKHQVGRGAGATLCRVTSMRHKLLHGDRLLLCAAVQSSAPRHLLCQLQLVVQVQRCGQLVYTCAAYKSVQRRPRNSAPSEAAAGAVSSTTIEPLIPCVLRPSKQAFVIATCQMPCFHSASSVTITALLQFTTKPLSPAATAPAPGTGAGVVYQVQCPSVTLDVLQLDRLRVNLAAPPPSAGVSLDTVALVTGSQQHHVTLSSVVCPLSLPSLLAALTRLHQLIRVRDVQSLYVLCAASSASLLHNAGLSLSQLDQHTVAATLYIRDSAQAVALVHSLYSLLPAGAVIAPAQQTRSSTDQHTRDEQQLKFPFGSAPLNLPGNSAAPATAAERMSEVLASIHRLVEFVAVNITEQFGHYTNTGAQEGETGAASGRVVSKNRSPAAGDTHSNVSKKLKLSEDVAMTSTSASTDLKEVYGRDRGRLEAVRRGVSVPRASYAAWRRDVLELQRRLDQLYIAASR